MISKRQLNHGVLKQFWGKRELRSKYLKEKKKINKNFNFENFEFGFLYSEVGGGNLNGNFLGAD